MNRIPTRSAVFTSGHLRLNGLILALALGLTTLPAMANISNSTNGRIHGRAPDVTGTPVILMPNGVTPVTNNAQVLWTAKTADFTLAPVSSYVTYVDADGDAPLGVGYTIPPSGGVSWAWTTSGGTILNASQLSQPFQNNFADGTVLKVTVAQAVDVASVSGMPNVRQRTLHSGTFDVVVKAPPPMIYVNGTKFSINSGFPRSGFMGARYQYYMNGTNTTDNGNYTYTSNQPWVTVNAQGLVNFSGTPTSANKNYQITIINKTNSAHIYHHTATVQDWFFASAGSLTIAQGTAACAAQSGVRASLADVHKAGSEFTRLPAEKVYNEWGGWGRYSTTITNVNHHSYAGSFNALSASVWSKANASPPGDVPIRQVSLADGSKSIWGWSGGPAADVAMLCRKPL